MKKTLVTGATGFLGKYIVDYLSEKTSIITLSRNSIDYKLSLELQIPVFNESFDIVIHNAGKAHLVPKTIEEEQAFFQVNVQGTNNLLKGLENTIILPKNFIYISSVAVYGLETGNLINENTPLLAKDPYGLSKIKAEQLIIDWCKKNNVLYTILRLPLLVGENPPGNFGAMINAIQKGYYFNIAGGHARKSMVLAEDVAKILLKASEIGGIYNLTDRFHPNFYELSNAIGNQNGKSSIFNLPFFIAKSIALIGDLIGAKFPLDSNKLKKITSDLTFDDTKATNFFGWNPNKILNYYK